MGKQQQVNMGAVMTIAGCVFLAWTFSFVSNEAYKEQVSAPKVIDKAMVERIRHTNKEWYAGKPLIVINN